MVIFVFCWAIYFNSLENSFHYDDMHSIVENPHIRTLKNIPAFFTTPEMFAKEKDQSMYRPVLLMSYAINYALGEYDVVGYHIFNILFHIGNALLIYWFVLLMGGDKIHALLAGLLFSVHPINTEPINYISSRSSLLATTFFLLGFCLFLQANRSISEGSKDRGILAYGLSLISYGLSILTKTIGITLVAMVMIYDLLFLCDLDWRKWGRRFVRYHLPYVGVAFIYVVAIRFIDPSVVEKAATGPVREYGEQILTQIKGYVYYIKLLLLPIGLNVEHQFFVSKTFFEWAVVFSFLLLASILYLSFRAVRFSKLVPFSVLWFYICLAPSSLVPLNVLVNERRLYISWIGFAILVGYLFARWVYGRGQLAKVGAAAAVLLFGCGLVGQRNEVWADPYALWRDAVGKSPGMVRAHTYLGNAYKDMGRIDEAEAEYKRAIEVKPEHKVSYNNLGNLYYQKADRYLSERNLEEARRFFDRATVEYKRALGIEPGYAEAHSNLGNVYFNRWRLSHSQEEALLDRARGAYERALEIEPTFEGALGNLGYIYYTKGMYDQAVAAYRKVLETKPDLWITHNNLGLAYMGKGMMDEAIREYRRALVLSPEYDKAHFNLAEVYEAKGLMDSAIVQYERALEISPIYAEAHVKLGDIYWSRRLGDRAISEYREAAKIRPYAEAHYKLGQVYRKMGRTGEAVREYQRAKKIHSGFDLAL